jgi:hypothetical protein
MNKTAFLFLGAVLSIAGTSAIVVGCGGDTTSGTSTTGGGGEGTTTSGSTTATSGGTGGAGTTSSTGTGAAATLDCASYCTEVMANCTTPTDTQYASMESCLTVCAAFPPGKLGDTEGNTLGCRIYHGGAPAVAMPDTHCAHAGITGGDKDVTDVMAGTCGEGCDAFCDVALAVCTGANKQYDTKETCLTDCKSFKVDAASYSTADTATNDFGCHAYHLTVAAKDAMSATAHCAHIVSLTKNPQGPCKN